MQPLRLLSIILILAISLTRAVEDNEFAEFEDDEPVVLAVKRDETTTAAPAVTVTTNVRKDEVDFADADEDFGLENQEMEDDTIDMSVGGDKDVLEGSDDFLTQPLKFAEVPAHFRSNWSSYQVEAIVIFLLLIYMLNYLAGKTNNQAIAFSWVESHRLTLEEQFSVVGDDGLSENPSSGQLNRETDNVFSMWCTGRAGVAGCMVHLRMIKRQDLVSRAWDLFYTNYDRVTLTFNVDAGEMDSFVIAAGQKKAVAKLHKEYLDLSQFSTERKLSSGGPQLPASYAVVSESSEVALCLADSTVAALAKKYEDQIEYIHISDQFSGPKPPEGEQLTRLPDTRHIAVFSFILNANADREAEEELLQMAFYVVDKMRRFRLSREAKQKSDKRRQTAQELCQKRNHQTRQEAAQARREEKTRERKQRLLEEEDPDKQRRLEVLEYKKELKAKQPRMKQMKMK